MPDSSSQDLTGVDEDRLFAVLSYLTVLVVMPLLLKRDVPFVRFHAQQGLVILIGLIMALIVSQWIPRIGTALFLVLLVLNVIALVQALLGRRWRIPLIGTIASKFSI